MKIVEYRGVQDLVYAHVTTDDNEDDGGYVAGEWKSLAGTSEISKSTESSSEAHYYDNVPAIVIDSTGSDTIELTVSAIPLDVLADITGQDYDDATGMLIEGEREPGYFAIGYKTKDTSGQVYYVVRQKGTFTIPEETHATEDDGTDANGQSLTFTGINTTHKFTKTGKTSKGIVVPADATKVANLDTFWDSVQTPDTVTAASA